jgi:hypothetical protein
MVLATCGLDIISVTEHFSLILIDIIELSSWTTLWPFGALCTSFGSRRVSSFGAQFFHSVGKRHRLDSSTSAPFLLIHYFYNKFLSAAILVLGLMILLQQWWIGGESDSAQAIGTVWCFVYLFTNKPFSFNTWLPSRATSDASLVIIVQFGEALLHR